MLEISKTQNRPQVKFLCILGSNTFLESCLHPHDEILFGYEEDVSSIQDGYTAWVKVDPAFCLERHSVCLNSAAPIFHEAQYRRHSSPNPEYRFNNDVSSRLTEPRRLGNRGWRVKVQNCARRKRTSITCTSNLPSLPWYVRSKVHKIRTTLKRR